ncbi:MAG: efflux RND transporter periplasmic adaptor subunit [Thermodesulfovibrionales bacterium]|nr:efflux RND transporter periplasmic adaptor subunit [Thermodesulfovibrionales bacterium]
MLKKLNLLVIFIAIISPLITSCTKQENKAFEEKIINVKVQKAEKKSVRPYIETIGTLSPYEEVVLSAEIDGIIKDIKADEGAAVSKGMLLAIISDTDYELDVKRAEAALKQAEATYANTKVEFQRKSALYKEQLVTQQQLDDVTTRLSLSEAEVEKAKASLFLAKQRLFKTKIYSPIDGFIKEKRTSIGNYVRNGSNLFVLIRNNPLKLNFSISEKDIGKIKKGQDVTFRVDAFQNREFKGKVNTIYPSLDEKTRTLQIEALTPNSDGLLKPGLFAKVILFTGDAREVVLIPAISLIYEGDRVTAYVVQDAIAKSRNLKIGQQHKIKTKVNDTESKITEYVEVIEGITEGEMIVTIGQQNLSENVKVKIID